MKKGYCAARRLHARLHGLKKMIGSRTAEGCLPHELVGRAGKLVFGAMPFGCCAIGGLSLRRIVK